MKASGLVGLSAATVARNPAINHERVDLLSGFTVTIGNGFAFIPIRSIAPFLSSAELLCVARSIDAVHVVVEHRLGVCDRRRGRTVKVVHGVNVVKVVFDINTPPGKLAF